MNQEAMTIYLLDLPTIAAMTDEEWEPYWLSVGLGIRTGAKIATRQTPPVNRRSQAQLDRWSKRKPTPMETYKLGSIEGVLGTKDTPSPEQQMARETIKDLAALKALLAEDTPVRDGTGDTERSEPR